MSSSETLSNKITSKVLFQQLSPLRKLSDLPKSINISTITITCKLDTEFDTVNIGKYIKLSKNRIYSVKYRNKNKNCIRTIIQKKSRRSKKKRKPKNIFYNQVTLEVYKNNSDKYVNVKLFKNGSIHMTGCRNLEDFIKALCILCKELNRTMGIINPKTGKDIIIKKFVTNIENLNLNKIYRFNINMINTNFRVNFSIDRAKLYTMLKSENITCMYEPEVHACVNIKYQYDDDKIISIFVFEKGSIIITAAKTVEQIKAAYNFITKKLESSKKDIEKFDMESFLDNIDTRKLQGN